MNTKPTWQLAEQIRDLPAIEEVIMNFAHDHTGDNATGIVLAVLEHAAAAEVAKADDAKLPPPELTWLYTHCRAIGMDCKSDSGKWEEDICLWTINLTNEITNLRAEAAKATGTAGELSDEEILKIQEKHIPKHGWSTNGLSFARDVLAAARQPAPVVAVKTWQESAAAHLPELREVINSAPFADVRASYMATEIADLRAALAAKNTKGQS